MPSLGSSGVPCELTWCVCWAVAEGARCALHLKYGEDLKTAMFDVDEQLPYVQVTWASERRALLCENCGGRGKCDVCRGRGYHRCGDSRCDSEHECGGCFGEGDCVDCGGSGWALDMVGGSGAHLFNARVAQRMNDSGHKDQLLHDIEYLRFNLLPVWLPYDERERRRQLQD